MILLFLLLANCPFGEGQSRVVAAGGGDEEAAEERPWAATASPTLAPAWFELVSYSNYETRPHATNLEPALARVLSEADDDDLVRVIAHLRPGDGIGATSAVGSEAADVRVRLVSRLQAAAEESQAPLRSYLEEEQRSGRVASYEPFWITNAIAVRARPSVVRELATHAAVKVVRLDRWRRWVDARPSDPGGATGVRDQPVNRRQSAHVTWNISRIRADDVWHTLRISGTGAVVAGMDTGVDWLHPALHESYRGYSAHGLTDHSYSWFDATEGNALYPVDSHGHGSHTLGTLVGEDGTGVAPGASWIAVRVLNRQGYGYDSWIHAGFEWVLAPGGDPARAPDVVNCSWGSSNASLTAFQEDLRNLRAAGIVPVFSSGNDGPGRGTLTSPASLPEAFAVGATDTLDDVASFSSRGPSPWGAVRPHVAAPGVHILSSAPGGAYVELNGTSMAAPHVAGIVALLRSFSPTLSITRTTYAITSTAVPLADVVPNNDTGWGRVDAFAAVAAVAQPGFITGTVRQAPLDGPASGPPIAGATVRASSRSGANARGVTDDAGAYSLALAPDVYDLTVSAFGYQTRTVPGISVITGTTTVERVSLTRVPTGTLSVSLVDALEGRPLTATMEVLDTPFSTTGDGATFGLPSGFYTIRATRLGYRVASERVAVQVGETTDVTLILSEAPSVLLVDSGGWYYGSEIAYFRQALDDLSYVYDEWLIRDLATDIPSTSDLMPYGIVIWTAPRDSPGYVGAGNAISGYLDSGGRLLLTGQDVGYWDDSGTSYHWSPYYRDYLKVRYVADNAPTRVLSGARDTVFAGETITITGAGGADNQDYPDVISVGDEDAAESVFWYQGDGCGGVHVGTCLDYRALYLPFGFEAINERDGRRAVMERSLDWLTAPLSRAGLELQRQDQLGIGPPGSVVTHTVRIRHLGQGGEPDRVSLTVEGRPWEAEVSDRSLALSPCTSSTVTISVPIPLTAARDETSVLTLTARSSLSPTVVASATFETKTPAPVLLVDDGRWYDEQSAYTDAMEQAGFGYDVWDTSRGRAGSGHHGPGPLLGTLQRYPVVVWWTGYDWYAPLTRDEEASLQGYLDGGGRLMFSSQDYLYYHHGDRFARDYLGVLTYTEDITPTHIYGVSEHTVGTDLGPWPLVYPWGYENWSDSVVPALGTGVAFRNQGPRGAAIALARREGKEATIFLPFPFEALGGDERPVMMERAVGWLSWLGRSAIRVEPDNASVGDTVTCTLTVHNDGMESVTASLSNAVPLEISPGEATLMGPGTYAYDPAERRFSWRGEILPGETATMTYEALVVAGGGEGDVIVNPVRFVLEDHRIAFHRRGRVRTAGPDLSQSAFSCSPSVLRPGRMTTCTLTLRNGGAADAASVTAYVHPPGAFNPAEASLWSSHGVIEQAANPIIWSGSLAAGAEGTLRFQLSGPARPAERTLYGVAFVDDGLVGTWERPAWLVIEPWTSYIPAVGRGHDGAVSGVVY